MVLLAVDIVMLVIPLIGLVVFIAEHSNLLTSLLMLEAIILMILVGVVLLIVVKLGEMGVVLICLTFSTCVATVGLSCMIALIRESGTMVLGSLAFSKC